VNRTLSLSLALALLVGCRNKDKDPADDTGGKDPVGETDRDGDGFTESQGDCDDYDAQVSPDAAELCDDVDNNCDGEIDEGVTLTLYADTDGDGFGDDANTQEACVPGDGWVEVGGDCDPTDADTYPEAAERCDNADNDCDGDIDEDIQGIWYLDADGDGFGDLAGEIESCDPGDEYVDNADDCNDEAAEAYPGAEEVCDELDNDCNGVVDDGVTTTYYQDADLDGEGDIAIPVQACEEPEGYASNGDDCDDGDATVNTAATELCDEIDNDCDGVVDPTDSADAGTFYADTDSDGYGDPLAPAIACEAPSGYLVDNTDCDDTDGGVNPGATEVCDSGSVDEDCDGVTNQVDDDADGYVASECGGDDCDDAAATTNPAAAEVWYDGTDADCAGDSDYDADGDGYDSDAYSGTDCDDTTASTNPGGIDVPYDGVDADCDGASDYDADGDGYDSDSYGGTDCDDGDAAVSPAGTEVWYDGADGDCDGGSDYDADGDGFDSDAYSGTDCDDTSAGVNPSASETWYDGADGDCDGGSDYDADADGYDSDSYGGTDCDDAAATTNPAASDTWYDGVDQDCAGDSDYDADLDGYDSDSYGGADCDDALASTNPGAIDVPYDGTDADCDGGSDYDADGDGYDSDAYGGDDCDDSLATVSPGATERYYDGIDGNCDGLSDYDKDGDGFDSSSYGGTDCADLNRFRYPGATERWYDGIDQDCAGDDDYDADADGDQALAYGGGDCDDNEALAYTGATEVCGDAVDNDCDGTAENVDADGDGYTPTACGGGDCADGNAARNPGATEIWYDGVDQDCDAQDDDDADGDGYQSDTEDSDGSLGTDCNDRVAEMNPGETEIPDDGYDNDCDGLAAGTTSQGAAADYAGLTITGDAVERLSQGDPGFAAAGDLNGDGIDDLVAGAIFDGTTATRAGAAYVVFGPLSSGSATTINTIADAKFVGEGGTDFAGRSVMGMGDVDGDGSDDLGIAALNEDAGGTNAGAIYIVNGPVGTGTINLSGADAKLTGESASDVFADLAHVGDFDNDGNDDILVGAQGDDDNGADAGAAYLFFGPVSGTIAAATADAKFAGDVAGDAAGSALAGVGDFDGDGRADIAVGAFKDDDGGTDAGAVSLILGSASPSDADVSSAAQVKWTGVTAGAGVGQFASVSAAGDVNDDGFADVLIGANTESGALRNAGAAYIILGSATPGSGTASLSTADAILTGAQENDRAGDNVGPGGDVDNDGFDDVVVGAGYSSYDSDQGGSVYVLTGPLSGTIDLQDSFFHTWVTEDGARASGRGVGDLDNDGEDDIIMGAWKASAQTGELHLFFGGDL
jgi:hypothetical protein